MLMIVYINTLNTMCKSRLTKVNEATYVTILHTSINQIASNIFLFGDVILLVIQWPERRVFTINNTMLHIFCLASSLH